MDSITVSEGQHSHPSNKILSVEFMLCSEDDSHFKTIDFMVKDKHRKHSIWKLPFHFPRDVDMRTARFVLDDFYDLETFESIPFSANVRMTNDQNCLVSKVSLSGDAEEEIREDSPFTLAYVSGNMKGIQVPLLPQNCLEDRNDLSQYDEEQPTKELPTASQLLGVYAVPSAYLRDGLECDKMDSEGKTSAKAKTNFLDFTHAKKKLLNVFTPETSDVVGFAMSLRMLFTRVLSQNQKVILFEQMKGEEKHMYWVIHCDHNGDMHSEAWSERLKANGGNEKRYLPVLESLITQHSVKLVCHLQREDMARSDGVIDNYTIKKAYASAALVDNIKDLLSLIDTNLNDLPADASFENNPGVEDVKESLKNDDFSGHYQPFALPIDVPRDADMNNAGRHGGYQNESEVHVSHAIQQAHRIIDDTDFTWFPPVGIDDALKHKYALLPPSTASNALVMQQGNLLLHHRMDLSDERCLLKCRLVVDFPADEEQDHN